MTLKLVKGQKHYGYYDDLVSVVPLRERKHESFCLACNGRIRTDLYIRPAYKREQKGGDSAADVLYVLFTTGQTCFPTPLLQSPLKRTEPTKSVTKRLET